MANNMNLPRNADTAAGGKWIKELIPKSMASIMQIAYVAICCVFIIKGFREFLVNYERLARWHMRRCLPDVR